MWIVISVALVLLIFCLVKVIKVYLHDKKIEEKLYEVQKALLEYDAGALKVATDGEDDPYIFLELKITPEQLMKKQRVMLSVVSIDVTQKKQ
jgi:uncharacterized phage-associated protein